MLKHILFASALASSLTLSGAYAEPVKLCHIANAGFLAEAGESAVLFDAVMEKDHYDGRFALPSSETLSAMQAGKDAFEKVKLALVTHRHGDHFDAQATLNHLRMDQTVSYVMPPEAYQLLLGAGLGEPEKSRVHAILPDWTDGPVKHKIGGVDLEIYRVDHGPNMPQNLGYRVKVGDKWVFHTGDINASAERLQDAGLNATNVDIMLMPFWYILEHDKTIRKAWDISSMVPMHYHATPQPWMADLGGPEGLRTRTATLWPNSVRLDREMQCQSMD